MTTTALATVEPAAHDPRHGPMAGVLGREHRRVPGLARRHDAVRGLRRAARGLSRATAADMSWVLNAYTVVYAAMLIPAGGLADTHGRKRVFLFGVTLFIAASVGLRPLASVAR